MAERHPRRAAAAFCLASSLVLLASVAQGAALASRDTPGDWSRYIIGLLPAIEVCMRDVPEQPAVVTGAYRVDGAKIGVRLRGPGGQRWACTAAANGRGSGSYESLEPGNRKPGEGDPLLTFGDAPDGECRNKEPLVEPRTGQLMGWLSYEVC
jgi:hypothetical protein